MASKVQFRRDTAANWTSANPTLSAGEIGYETDTNKLKIGDGSSAWTALIYAGTQMVASSGDSITSTSMVDISGLSIPITAGTWAFEVTVGYASSSTAGCRFCINHTGTLSSINYMQLGQLATTTLGATTNQTTNNSSSGTIYGTTANAIGISRMTGLIVATGAGTLSARGLKVTSGTLTIYNGTMTLQKVA